MDKKLAYFATDGSYGDADGISIIDTTNWDETDWEIINEMNDNDRYGLAVVLSNLSASDTLRMLDELR